MQAAAASERFEDAARVRDQLQAVERSLERQKVVQAEGVDQDVFGVFRAGPHLEVALLSVRQGRLHEGQQFHFSRQEFPTEELLGAFLTQFYERATTIPREVLLPLQLDDAPALAEWLGERAGRTMQVATPQRGEKLRLVAMANANAEQANKERAARGGDAQETLLRLQHKLNLTRLPRTIECYDISNFQGTEAVGSKVAFRDGEPDKARYRRFKIRTVQGQDDFAMLYEVLTRRLRRGMEEGDLPDLLVIDGGMGQLQVAVAALRDLAVPGVEVVSLAKSRVLDSGRRLRSRAGPRSQAPEHSSERVFLPGVKDPIPLRPHTSELFLLQRLRDEAHRFAIQYHRGLRDRRTLGSELQEIPGVGPARRRALLRRFGSLRGIRKASADQLSEVPGVTPELAERISRALSAVPTEGQDPASA
jgi:excinuclease ABC subunit C